MPQNERGFGKKLDFLGKSLNPPDLSDFCRHDNVNQKVAGGLPNSE